MGRKAEIHCAGRTELVSGILGVASRSHSHQAIVRATWQLFGDDELSERWVAVGFPALFFADDRGREGA
jgi:hypothetical protein